MIKKTPKKRASTKTSPFGTNGRINHDSTAYYSRSMQPKSHKKTSSNLTNEQILPTEILNKYMKEFYFSLQPLPCKRKKNRVLPSPCLHFLSIKSNQDP